MVTNRIIWICCISLAASGFIIGANWLVEPDILQTLNLSFTAIGAFATVGLLYLGSKAFSVWKLQFAYTEKFKAFVDLEKSFLNAIASYTKLVASMVNKHDLLIGVPADKLKYIEIDDDKAQLDFKVAKRDYAVKVDWAMSFLPDENNFELDYIAFESELHKGLRYWYQSLNANDSEVAHEMMCKAEQLIIDFNLKGKKLIREQRNK
ncbi:hypothetical protein QTU67_003651 [Vibrio cholerae]|uniref:hypothetical protein n=1 Tax=Vibrio cholerae TaxID=666 RepID=UPI000D3BB898|nr:hypothetical protein [Vibrio cholerae]AWB72094.1 hypothetical protein Sa5Y_VCA02992 [Vibrio cholerae]EGQ7881759.1 hypothetical protein [Vibrio cholerae]EGQ9437272.1 hypothetical protein [Vibrio cholerae]EGQ9634190.1 hypothetical protein [Vibrio cholerae]EGR0031404.1 hypothetical protein [Vibrio cholerae]